ncbi:unnamed protein product, partial [Prorocentrum cordatum]
GSTREGPRSPKVTEKTWCDKKGDAPVPGLSEQKTAGTVGHWGLPPCQEEQLRAGVVDVVAEPFRVLEEVHVDAAVGGTAGPAGRARETFGPLTELGGGVAVPPEGFLALESPRESRGRRRLAGAGRAGAVGPVRGPRVGRPGFRLGPDASAAGCWSRRGVAARFRGPGAVKNGGRPIATTQERRSPVSLLQVAVRRSVWLFDMGAICGDGDLSAAAASLLRDVLESPVLLKVGYGLDNDLGRLAYTLPEALPDRARGVLDLRVLAPRALAGPVSGGLSGLSRAVLGKGLDKTEQVSDWARRPLREESSWCTRRRTRTCASACSTRSATATQRSRRGRWSP